MFGEASKPRRCRGGQSSPLSPASALATDASARWGICSGNMFCPRAWHKGHKATFHNFSACVSDSVHQIKFQWVYLFLFWGLDFQNLACTFHEFPAAMLPSVRTWRQKKTTPPCGIWFPVALEQRGAATCSRHVLPLEPLCSKRTQLWSTAFVRGSSPLESTLRCSQLGHERPQCAGDWASCNASRHKSDAQAILLRTGQNLNDAAEHIFTIFYDISIH